MEWSSVSLVAGDTAECSKQLTVAADAAVTKPNLVSIK